jgi:hypothetical protein
MQRLKIEQASSDHEAFMKRCGFRHNLNKLGRGIDGTGFASHMIPEEGKEFFVYFQKPSEGAANEFRYDRENWDGYDGFFTIVCMEDGKEILVDTGWASDAHIHTGIDTFTFYGKGIKLGGTWTFHCEISVEAAIASN